MYRDDIEGMVAEVDARDDINEEFLPSEYEIGQADYLSADADGRISLYMTAEAMLGTARGNGDQYWQGIFDAHLRGM